MFKFMERNPQLQMAILEGLGKKMLHTLHHDKPIRNPNVTYCSSGVSLSGETYLRTTEKNLE